MPRTATSDPAAASRAERILRWAASTYGDRLVLASSFGGASGMVLVDLAARAGLNLPVFYLDTGLLFAETHDLVARVRETYGIEPIAVRAELSLDAQAAAHGDALWAREPDACCALRKVEPQRRFLANYDAWITGLRRDQADTRKDVPFVRRDVRSERLVKIAPLADWTEADVWSYLVRNDVPYNALHDRGYPSIGCTPCTRAIRPGEDARAGRWSGTDKVECGLHVAAAR